MGTPYCIGHTKFTVTVILHKGVETTTLHISLQYDFGIREILCINPDNTYVIAVCRCIKQIKFAVIHYKIRTRLTFSD